MAPVRVAATLAAAFLVVAQGLPASAGLTVLDALDGDCLEAAKIEYAARAAVQRAEAASGLNPFLGRLANWPHRGPITSPFAPRWGGFHNGLDIAAPFFTPVHAAAAGMVTTVGRPYAAFGDIAMTVGIAHGDNFTTVYVHLDDRRPPVVSIGQRVNAGQLVAYVGTTGWSTGPHTHFMTIANGRAVDPMGYLPP